MTSTACAAALEVDDIIPLVVGLTAVAHSLIWGRKALQAAQDARQAARLAARAAQSGARRE